MLVIRLSALGDVAMVLPVLYDVCRQHPDVTFLFATRPSMTHMAVNPPSNLVLLGVDVHGEHKGLRGMLRFLHQVRDRYPIDAFADLHGVIRSHWMALLCRLHGIAVAQIDKGRREKAKLTAASSKDFHPLTPSTERYRKVFTSLGLPSEAHFVSLFGDGRGDAAAFDAVTGPKKGGERWVGIAPFAAHRGKIYPLDKMWRVVEQLSSIKGVKVFLLGAGKDEKRVFDLWREKASQLVSLADKRHGFPVELALLSHMDAVVSMDSANMHLASLVGVPVVSVWGATHPFCGFSGWRQSELGRELQLSLDCRPCSVFGNKPCHNGGEYPCLAGISPDVIVKAVKDIIS